MSIKAKTEWVGDDMLTLEISCYTASELIKRCRANSQSDANLEADLKAAMREAAKEKADRLARFFS